MQGCCRGEGSIKERWERGLGVYCTEEMEEIRQRGRREGLSCKWQAGTGGGVVGGGFGTEGRRREGKKSGDRTALKGCGRCI